MANGEISKYREARKAAEKERVTRVFIAHLGAYIIGNIIIGLWNAGTYYLRDNDNLWFWLPLLFWGVGVIVHYLQAIALFDNWWDRDERLIEERLKKMGS